MLDVELDLEDIAQRLRELQAYSPVLAGRTEKEGHLPPGGTAAALADAIDEAVKRCGQAAMTGAMGVEMETLGKLLDASYHFYLTRLAAAGLVWNFRFPAAFECTHAPVTTYQ